VTAAIDPIRMEVIRNALESIADGMALTVVRTSRSSVVRTSLDFSTGVLGSNGELVGQSLCSPPPTWEG
jgi:N-methylhydantoinase B